MSDANKPITSDAEWKNEVCPWPLWGHLIDVKLMPERKRRLFAVAACRRVECYLTDPRSHRMLEACEAYAEGMIDIDEFLKFDSEARTAARELADSTVLGEIRLAADAAKWLGVDEFKVGRAAEFSCELFGFQAMVREGFLEPTIHAFDTIPFWQHPVFITAQEAEEAVLADILREVFANPFRAIEIEPEWKSSDVVSLALAIYENRHVELMPMLADALQDAGCENAEILDHCRESRIPHVKGCWVVDLILDKM